MYECVEIFQGQNGFDSLKGGKYGFVKASFVSWPRPEEFEVKEMLK